jgi:hypothetical protein
MKKAIIENWFKVSILSIVIIFGYFYLNIKHKEFRLEVINSARQCVDERLSDQAFEDCRNKIRDIYNYND